MLAYFWAEYLFTVQDQEAEIQVAMLPGVFFVHIVGHGYYSLKHLFHLFIFLSMMVLSGTYRGDAFKNSYQQLPFMVSTSYTFVFAVA